MKMLHLSKAVFDKYYVREPFLGFLRSARLFDKVSSPRVLTKHALVGTDVVPANALLTQRVTLRKGITHRRTEQKPLRPGAARRARLRQEREVAEVSG